MKPQWQKQASDRSEKSPFKIQPREPPKKEAIGSGFTSIKNNPFLKRQE